MHLIDRYAYTNRLSRVNPAFKAAVTVWLIGLTLGLNRPLIGVAVVCWIGILMSVTAQIPFHVYRKLLMAEATFLLLTSIGIGLTITFSPTVAQAEGWAWQLGPLWVATSPAALDRLLHTIMRAVGAAAALNFLALTTPVNDVVHLLRTLKLPETLIDIMLIMYRFIFVLFETLENMLIAQRSRLGYQAGYRRSMASAGAAGANLFLHTLTRAERIENAIAARAFDGRLHVLPPSYRPFPSFWAWAAVMTLTLAAIEIGARLYG